MTLTCRHNLISFWKKFQWRNAKFSMIWSYTNLIYLYEFQLKIQFPNLKMNSSNRSCLSCPRIRPAISPFSGQRLWWNEWKEVAKEWNHRRCAQVDVEQDKAIRPVMVAINFSDSFNCHSDAFRRCSSTSESLHRERRLVKHFIIHNLRLEFVTNVFRRKIVWILQKPWTHIFMEGNKHLQLLSELFVYATGTVYRTEVTREITPMIIMTW